MKEILQKDDYSKRVKWNHYNAGIVIEDGESIYEKGLYITSDPDLKKADHMNFSKPLTKDGRILIMFHSTGASYLAIGVEGCKKLAAWLLEGLQ